MREVRVPAASRDPALPVQGAAVTALHLWAATCGCPGWTKCRNCSNPTFLKVFRFLQWVCKNIPGAGFGTLYLFSLEVYIPSPLALLILILCTETQSLALQGHTCTSPGTCSLFPLPKELALSQSWSPLKRNTSLHWSNCCAFPQHQKVSPPLWPCATTAAE